MAYYAPKSKDGDHVDVFIGPHVKSPHVFIIDQLRLEDRKFDEHKILLGFGSEKQALDTYRKSFSDGRGTDRVGAVSTTSIPLLKAWLRYCDTTKPFSAKLSHTSHT